MNRADPRQLRILLVSMAPVLSRRAPSVQVANMAQAFAEQGHDVTVLTPIDDATSRDVAPSDLLGFVPSFRHKALSRRVHRGQSYVHALRIARIARRMGIEFVYSRSLRGCLLPALLGIPTVLEAHTLNTFTGFQDRWFLRRLLRTRGLRGIVAISQGLADDLADVLGVPRGRILVAHDAVRPRVRAAVPLSTAGERFEVGYTGSLYEGRGVEMLIAAAERAPWLRLHLVGGPPEAAVALRDGLAASALADRVVVHGLVTPAQARELQSGFSVLVAPFERRVLTDSGIDSSRWMSPMKIFEYMASGRPIVVSDLPVLREVLRPEVDALMIPPEDIDALVRALERLRDDSALGRRLAASALERVEGEFTWDRRVTSILDRCFAGQRRTVTIVLASFGSGGAERVLLNLAAGLADRGVHVSLIVLDTRGPLAAEVDPRVELIDLGRPRVRVAGPRLVGVLRRARPDAVLSSQTHVSALIGLIRPFLPRATRVVFREPLLQTERSRRAVLPSAMDRLLARADAVVASSTTMASDLQRRLGARSLVQVVPNPVASAELRSAAGPCKEDRSSEEVRAVVVGRLVSQKGHQDLIDALADPEACDVVLEVIGDGPLREELEARARASGLNDRILFRGRLDDRAALACRIAAADVLVQPAHVEGMPNTVLEALALGTPVLATNDLLMLSDLAAELGPTALRLVPRSRLAEALTTTPRRRGPRPAPTLLPARFDVARVTDRFLALLLPDGA